jgi:TonB-dependent receptor
MRCLVPPGRTRSRDSAARVLAGAALVALASFLMFPPALYAEEASGVVGRIFSIENGAPLRFANVVFIRTDLTTPGASPVAQGTVARRDGTYRIELAPGTYALEVQYIGYASLRVSDVAVTAGQFTVIDAPLTVQAIQMETVEVNATTIRNTQAAVLAKQKSAPAVSDGISAEQIKRGGDSNAAEVANRVTGVSVVGGKYVYVRGLGERYSATMVNGNTIGSPEPNKKVVPLDLFPSGMVETFVIQKTYTPDQPGEFGGGVVDIRSLAFPGERSWSLSVSGGEHAPTTGKDFYTYAGGDHDYWGFSDGVRDLPGLLEELAPDQRVFHNTSLVGSGGGFDGETITALGRAFNKVWEPTRETAQPKHSYAGSYGDEIQLFSRSLGVQSSFSLNHAYQQIDFEERLFEAQTSDSSLSTRYDYRGQDSEASTLWGGLLNASYRVSDRHTLTASAMYNRSMEDLVRRYEGVNTDTGRDARVTRLQYVERGVFVGSAGMAHDLRFLNDTRVEWRGSYSWSERNEPDRREYLYELSEQTDSETGETVESWVLTRRSKSLGFTRLFTGMDEYDRGLQLDVETPFPVWGGREATAKVGTLLKNKDRNSATRRFGFVTPGGSAGLDLSQSPEELLIDENIGAGRNQFVLDELTQATDKYAAHHDLHAQYAMVDVPLTRRLRFVGGARLETSDFEVVTRDPFLPDAPPVVASLDDRDVLPSANLAFALTEEINLRGAYSRTLARPDVRELTPFSLPDFASGFALIGNPELNRTQLDNYDLRAEWYPGAGELIALSGFYKDLTDPIELSLQSVAGNPALMPVNGHEAFLYGTEAEARVGLGRFTTRLHNFGVSTNVTLVKSEAKIQDESGAGLEARERPLQGQPPYVFNAGLFFETRGATTSASLAYNVFGRRLHAVGLRTTPDIYEEPRRSVDLAIGQKVGPVRIKAGAENLLDEDEKHTQELDSGATFTQHRAETGRSFSLSIGYGS